MANELERFERKYEVDTTTGCWRWTAYIDPFGYGRFSAAGEIRAHRWSYKHFVGPIPDGLVIDHICRVRCCVNPAHLRAVTSGENTWAPGSIAPAKILGTSEACVNGHPWTEASTRLNSKGYRSCRICANESNRRQRADARSQICEMGHMKVADRQGRLYCRPCQSEKLRRPPKPPAVMFGCGHERAVTAALNSEGRQYCTVCRVMRRGGDRRLSDETVRAVRLRHAEGGMNYSEIGREFEIDPRLVRRIVLRQCYPAVT